MIIKAGMILKPGARITIAPGSGDAMYRFDSDTGTILEYLGGGSSPLIIPLEIDGVPVTAIGPNAFGLEAQTQIVIQSTMLLWNNSFQNNIIESVSDKPDNLADGFFDLSNAILIGQGAFALTQARELKIAPGTLIQADAFIGTYLNRITIGEGCELSQEQYTFGYNEGFKAEYDKGGAGVYQYKSAKWELQV